MPPCRMVSFCLPVAGWPLAGASFLFLRAVAATTKVFTSSPTAHASPSSLSPDFTHTLSLWVLVFQSGPHRRSRLFPTDNGPSASVNRTPPTRRHRPGRPLSCRPRALDADCPIPVVRPPSATNSTVSLARRLQIVPAPSVLVANPRGSIPQPPPSISRSACCKVQTAQRRVQSGLRTRSVLACGRPICSRPLCVSPRQRLLRWLGGSSSFVLPTTPDVNSFAGFLLTPPPRLVCVCLFVSLRTPGPPRGSRPLESCIQGTCSLGGVSSSPPAREPRSCRPTHHWRWCRTFV